MTEISLSKIPKFLNENSERTIAADSWLACKLGIRLQSINWELLNDSIHYGRLNGFRHVTPRASIAIQDPRLEHPCQIDYGKKFGAIEPALQKGDFFYGKSRRIREMKVSTAEQFFSHTVVEGTALWDLLARWWKLEKKLHFTSQSLKIVMSQIMRILHADVSVGRNNSSKKGRGDWLYGKRALKSSVSNLLFN